MLILQFVDLLTKLTNANRRLEKRCWTCKCNR